MKFHIRDRQALIPHGVIFHLTPLRGVCLLLKASVAFGNSGSYDLGPVHEDGRAVAKVLSMIACILCTSKINQVEIDSPRCWPLSNRHPGG